MIKKVCKRCNKEKDITQFNICLKTEKKAYRRDICKGCIALSDADRWKNLSREQSEKR